jgi:hypothetical protein
VLQEIGLEGYYGGGLGIGRRIIFNSTFMKEGGVFGQDLSGPG